MSLFDLQDVCIAIGSPETLDLPMVVDMIGIYVLKGPYLRIDGGRSIPVVDRIGGSTAAYSLKCRFPPETGRSQAPRRQQGSGIRTRHRQPQQWYQSTGLDPSIHCCHNCIKSRIFQIKAKFFFGDWPRRRPAARCPTALWLCDAIRAGRAWWPRHARNIAHHAGHHRALAARWIAPGRALAARLWRVGRAVIVH
ncbi:fanciful K+ uptake-b family transporter [Dorcoceras hygrometricum]|nr:fanciful K+ uptake-b family transporter [Dorcoceras hygrometricum]